ncbi:hypothetical protein L484_027697 [Morus notabilis]|uniref:Uncharacterized protein n=1 Tax=Morus notabilis TaxID=981085 RepID=W9RN26_9ROSA|nr:hypothetical protein L484_027697 [Morus notabilis]
MLLQSCKGGNACIESGLRFLSLRKKQPPLPPAPTRNSNKIHGVVNVSEPRLSSLMNRIKAYVYGSAPPSP